MPFKLPPATSTIPLGNSVAVWPALSTVMLPVDLNVGYFVVYLLTPVDLRWQLMFSIERLVFHTMPLAIFVAFLAVLPFDSGGGTARTRRFVQHP